MECVVCGKWMHRNHKCDQALVDKIEAGRASHNETGIDYRRDYYHRLSDGFAIADHDREENRRPKLSGQELSRFARLARAVQDRGSTEYATFWSSIVSLK